MERESIRDSSACGEADYYRRYGLDRDRVALWYYARVVRRLRPEGGRLLDFGCGAGHLLRRLADRFETYGCDASAHARSLSRRNAPAAVIVDDRIPLPSSSFDAIVALHTLEHIEQPLPVMQRLAALLRPGGLFLFVVPNPDGVGKRLKGTAWFAYRDPTHRSLLSKDEWLELARQAGLEVEWVRGDGLWDAPYVRWIPSPLQRLLFGTAAALQLALPVRRPFLPPFLGECLIVAASKPQAK